MNQISGATVGVEEAKRLKKQLPDPTTFSSTNFLTAYDEYKDDIDNAMNGFLTGNGFTDYDTARNTII